MVSVLKTEDGKEMILMCDCECDEGMRIKVAVDEDIYCYQTYLKGNWYAEQGRFFHKLKKIWKILRNKDFYYSEILMNKQDWERYKKWINEQG